MQHVKMAAPGRLGATPHAALPVLALLVSVVVGCGGNQTVPIEAKLLLDGEPLTDATVTFVRTQGEEGRAAYGVTNSSGVARLTTYEINDGAQPGQYSVVVLRPPTQETIEKIEPKADDINSLMRASAPNPQRQAVRYKRVRTTISEVYAAAETTPLKCVVSSGMEPPVFELSSNP